VLRVGALAAGVLVILAICASVIADLTRPAPAMAQEIVITKSPTCLCCDKWVAHVKKAGFRTRVESVADLAAVKEQRGVPALLGSCHTAVVDGYVIEGHVPAEDIQRLLRERPDVAGLAVPGMPMGSPGMEGPRRDRYEVIAFQKDGTGTVFARR
jgi:hypothetical protein